MFAPASARPNQRWWLPLALGLFVLLCDQASKRWIMAMLGPQPYVQRISLGPDWLNLVYTQNTGVAFGLFQNVPQIFTFTSIIITIGVLYVYVAYLPNQITWIQVAIGLICGGAIGNIIDRLRFGHVVDLISVGWFPVFNLADSAISVGVTMLAGFLIFIGDEPDADPQLPPRDDGLLTDLLNRDID